MKHVWPWSFNQRNSKQWNIPLTSSLPNNSLVPIISRLNVYHRTAVHSDDSLNVSRHIFLSGSRKKNPALKTYLIKTKWYEIRCFLFRKFLEAFWAQNKWINNYEHKFEIGKETNLRHFDFGGAGTFSAQSLVLLVDWRIVKKFLYAHASSMSLPL